MTDDLRTRIGSLLFAHCSVISRGEADCLADAVIRELQLRREQVELLHRYITKWET